MHTMHRDTLWKQLKTKQKNNSTHKPETVLQHNIPEPLLNGIVYVTQSQPLAWRPQNCPTDYFMERDIGAMIDRVLPKHIHAYGFPLCYLRLCEHEEC